MNNPILLLLALVVCACSSEPTAPPSPAGDTPIPAAKPAAETAKPEPSPPPEPEAPAEQDLVSVVELLDMPDTIEGADAKAGDVTIDGFKVERLVCKAAGGMFGALAIAGKLAEQKEAFAKCAEAKEMVMVHFHREGGKYDDIRVAGATSPEVAKCAGKAVAEAALPNKCTCIVSFNVGPPEAPAAP